MVDDTNFAILCLPVQSDSETTTASSGTLKFAACTLSQTCFHPTYYLSRQVMAVHQTRNAGSIFWHCLWPRPGISEGNARKPIRVSYRVDCPKIKASSEASSKV